MLRALRDMVRRIGVVAGVLLSLGFAMPALASHICASELSPPAAEATASAPADRGAPCPDCGPACANGCCHASHVATPADLGVAPANLVFAAPAAWTHVTGRLLDAPAGPERPPRP